jgi:hypothetical protein
MTVEFVAFDKIPRLRRGCTITEKIDGTNAQVYIPEDGGPVLAGSRNRWITPEADNFGFAAWVQEHAEELRAGLGPGRHFGEWWGSGIQRRYGLDHKRFSLFNTSRWTNEDGKPHPSLPACVHVVPVLYNGVFAIEEIDAALGVLAGFGSVAAPGFMNPEGIVVYHHASRTLHKVTLGDDGHKEGRAA